MSEETYVSPVQCSFTVAFWGWSFGYSNHKSLLLMSFMYTLHGGHISFLGQRSNNPTIAAQSFATTGH